MFFAHETHDVEPDAFATPHVVPYWAWTMATRMVLRLMSMTSGTMTIIGTARPNTVAPFTRPCPPFPVLSAIGPSHHRHAYCNPFHADTGGTDADNQKKPRRKTMPRGADHDHWAPQGRAKKRTNDRKYQVRNYSAPDIPNRRWAGE